MVAFGIQHFVQYDLFSRLHTEQINAERIKPGQVRVNIRHALFNNSHRPEFSVVIFTGNSVHQVAESALACDTFSNALALMTLHKESLYLYTVLIITSAKRLFYE